jgi:hypothetical protein
MTTAMDQLKAFLPSGEKGYLPYYLFVVRNDPRSSQLTSI